MCRLWVRLLTTIVQRVRRQIVHLCKSISWQKRNSLLKIEERPSVLDSDTSRHMSKLSVTVATGAFSQLGSSDTFCAVT